MLVASRDQRPLLIGQFRIIEIERRHIPLAQQFRTEASRLDRQFPFDLRRDGFYEGRGED
jgi:hypothetical protein